MKSDFLGSLERPKEKATDPVRFFFFGMTFYINTGAVYNTTLCKHIMKYSKLSLLHTSSRELYTVFYRSKYSDGPWKGLEVLSTKHTIDPPSSRSPS